MLYVKCTRVWERLPNLGRNNLELQHGSLRVIPHVTLCRMSKMGGSATMRVVISWERDQWVVWIKLSFANGEP